MDDRNDHSDSPISGGDDVFQRKCIAEDVVGQVYGGDKFLSSLVDRRKDGGGSQRSNVAGSPEVVVHVIVAGLSERISFVGWLSCKAEITGRTRRSTL